MKAEKNCAEVALAVPLRRAYSYLIPEGLRDQVRTGMRVLVPLRNRRVTGFVVAVGAPPEGHDLKEIADVLDDAPLFDAGELAFFRWIASYYASPLGEVLKTALPAGIGVEEKKTVTITSEGVEALALGGLPALQGRVLEELEAGKAMPARTLNNRLGRRVPGSTLDALAARGLVEVHRDLQDARTRPLTVKVVTWTGDEQASVKVENLGRRAPRRAELMQWLSGRGRASISEVRTACPSASRHLGLLEAEGLVSIEEQEVCRDPFHDESVSPERAPILTDEQNRVLAGIEGAIRTRQFSPFLLNGITGSGKTEVYMRAIAIALELGRKALVLVPEISLTPQTVRRFRARFGDCIAVLHSGLSAGERFDQWRRIKRGEVPIVIGARSAVFAPIRKLGVVVVDEEHDPSYKQEEGVRYNARDLAVVRAKSDNALVILGSATPSLESTYNAGTGKFFALSLSKRIGERDLPAIEIVNMREEDRSGGGIFSASLRAAIGDNFLAEGQSLLFLNRRGFANFMQCRSCGHVMQCRDCSISMTYHQGASRIVCHYCDFSTSIPGKCPECGKPDFLGKGIGTERIEAEVRSILPGARIVRMDRDTMRGRNAHARVIEKIRSGAVDVVVGTQMITKGHDFPGITLVGILAADASLHFPDFRSSERTFQLITQVAGRAGRGDQPGRVVIQTYSPNHYSILHASSHAYSDFYDAEIVFRKELGYPPFSRLANLRVQGGDEKKTRETARAIAKNAKALANRIGTKSDPLRVLGPSTAPLFRIKKKYRFNILIRGCTHGAVHRLLDRLLDDMESKRRIPRGVDFHVDVDPVSMM
ncbi:primosomal protein N' [Thermodesulfobacteriota bacterium]